jgi:hypothetical protein
MKRYQFKSFDHLLRAMDRWFTISKRQRCDAIVKQHGLKSAEEIFCRDYRGKCVSQYAFVAEYDGVMVTFDYWGYCMIGEYTFDAPGDIGWESYAEVVRDAILNPEPPYEVDDA